MYNHAPLAYVRLADGTTAELEHGDKLPEGADEAHVKRLAEQGVLAPSKPKAPEVPPAVAGNARTDG